MHELRVNTSNRSPDQISTFTHPEAIKMKKGTSLDHILKEITNFGGLEAETRASLHGLMGWERAKSIDTLTKDDDDKVVGEKEQSFKSRRDKFKDLLINENLVIIEKEKDKRTDDKTNDDEHITSKEKPEISNEMPVPNTVRRYKDIFETLSKTLDGVSRNPSRKGNAVSRSISVRVTSADWRQTKPEYRDIVNKFNVEPEDRRKTLPGRLVLPIKSTDEIEQARDWLNACSPVTPDIIQKLREHGTSMTFFGRPAYSPSVSPTQEEDWSLRKPRVIGVTPKNNLKPPSLSSSSTCSDEELHFASSFDYPSTDSEYLRNQLADDDSGHDEDSYTYDVVFLDGAYSRSATPQLAFRHKGVWLRDPFWSGSNYIVYDFRGTDVQPHVRVDAR